MVENQCPDVKSWKGSATVSAIGPMNQWMIFASWMEAQGNNVFASISLQSSYECVHKSILS